MCCIITKIGLVVFNVRITVNAIYLRSLVTPVYSLHFCTALLSRFNELNDDDDDNNNNNNSIIGFNCFSEYICTLLCIII